MRESPHTFRTATPLGRGLCIRGWMNPHLQNLWLWKAWLWSIDGG